MKIRLPAKELKFALTGLSRVINRKTTLPVLSTVRIEADQDHVCISATDLNAYVSYACQSAEVVESGNPVLIDHKRLKDALGSSNKDEVELEVLSDTSVHIGLHGPLGDREQVLPAFGPDEWPPAPPEVATQPADPKFLSYFQSLIPFSSTDETRAVLNGVCVDVKDGKHTLVATDGRRLTTFNSIELPVVKTQIIPSHKFLSWTKLDSDARIGVSSAKSDTPWFRLESGAWAFISRTVEGTYPNWRQVVPKSAGDSGAEIAEEDIPVFEEAVRTLPGSNKDNRVVTLVNNNGCVRLTAHDPDSDTWCKQDLTNSRYIGNGNGVSVDRVFLRQAVKAGFRTFHWKDDMSPLMSRDGNGGLHVLMPVRGGLPESETKTKNNEPKTTEEPPVIDKPKTQTRKKQEPDQLWLSYQQVKEKVRELNATLTDLGTQIKESQREGKSLQSELNTARSVLSKLQTIKL